MVKTVCCFVILLLGIHCSVIGHPSLEVVEIVEKTQNVSDIAPDPFILGGQPAQVGQFPWIARLTIRGSHLCGGSLISKRHVLTAAHCVHKKFRYFNDLEIYLGEYDRHSYPVDCVQGKCTENLIVYPIKIIKHARYNPKTYKNDIALLRLQKGAPLGAIRPIALPPFDIDHSSNDGVDMLVTGWGKTETGHSSNILLTTQLHLVAHKKCLKQSSAVPRRHLCAGDANGRDTCAGDSGGPLMIYYQNKYYLSGVVSYGPKCGTPKAGYYTNVFKYMKWIKSKMSV